MPPIQDLPGTPRLLTAVRFEWLGRLAFGDAVCRNEAAVRAVTDGAASVLLAFEPSEPTFTLGRRAQTAEGRVALASTLAACRARGIAVQAVDRGGLGTLHLPGQLVVFLALSCARERLRPLVAELLAAARQLALEHGVVARIDASADVGLWSAEGKLASIGLREQRGVVGHGLAVNVAIEPAWAAGLALCGSAATRYASLGPAVAPDSPVLPRAAARFAAVIAGGDRS